MPSLHLSKARRWFLSSPPVEWAIKQLKKILIGALRQGPIPQHVAFVMDGNRRFARTHQIETLEGHNLGFEALARVGDARKELKARKVVKKMWPADSLPAVCLLMIDT
jgi:ditrans,polycis-polyprenyl diphosphate synthase